MSAEILNITAEESGERIDALLARSLTELSRSAAQRLIEEGRVTLDGRPVKKNKKTEAGEVYELELPEPVRRASRTSRRSPWFSRLSASRLVSHSTEPSAAIQVRR